MTPGRKLAAALLLTLLLAGGAGCRKKPVQAAPPAPPAPAEAEPAKEEKAEKAEEEKKEEENKAEPPPALVVPRPRPQPAPPPQPEPPRPAAPVMSPRLTPQQQAEYEKKTREDIATAERNLSRANGRALNAAQKDMVEKTRGFLAQSREAIRAADWVRAQNLAEKARLLSIELVNSL